MTHLPSIIRHLNEQAALGRRREADPQAERPPVGSPEWSARKVEEIATLRSERDWLEQRFATATTVISEASGLLEAGDPHTAAAVLCEWLEIQALAVV